MSTSPNQPVAPDLTALTLNDSSLASNPWGTQPAADTSQQGEVTPSGSFWSSQEPQIQSIPKLDTDEFDPFAPTKPRAGTPTIGSTVKAGSRLELLPAEDDDQSPDQPADWNAHGPNLTWTNTNPPATPTRDSSTSPNAGRPKALPLISGTGREGTGSGFLGMFRSRSGGGSPRPPTTPLQLPPISQADHEKGMLESELSEKGGLGQAGGRHPTVTSHGEGSAGPSNPLNSIANVFRSATSRNGSASGTPLSGSSPTEKEAYLEMARGGSAQGVSGAEQHHGAVGAKGKEVDRAPVEAVFDFNKFLEQMRQRSADPIAKYLRSFLKEFSRKPPTSTADQVKVINDFLDFIAGKMRTVDPWRAILAESDQETGEAEFDMALEAMEKLVMNRLWHLTFTPALDLSAVPGQMSITGDIERDQVLSQRIRLFSWISPKHLDLPIEDPTTALSVEMSPSASRSSTPQSDHPPPIPGSEDGTSSDVPSSVATPRKGKSRNKDRQAQGFLDFARRELIKMNQYKAPRDKLICILNSCKVIFGLMRHVATDEGADAFIPFLIYVVLQANPEHLVSNIQYIQRFRNPDKLTGEGGYYLSSLGAAISFIESLDHSSLSHISKEEFEANVAEAIAALPIDPNDDSVRLPKTPTPTRTTFDPNDAPAGEAGDEQSPAVLNQPGLGMAPGQQGRSFPESTKALLQKGTDSVERAISKPIGAIGALFDQLEGAFAGDTPPAPGVTRQGVPARRRSQLVEQRSPRGAGPQQAQGQGVDPGMFAGEGMTARQVTDEIDRQHEQQRLAAINTLKSIFPGVESEVLEMVLLANSEDMARTIDALLEMAG